MLKSSNFYILEFSITMSDDHNFVKIIETLTTYVKMEITEEKELFPSLSNFAFINICRTFFLITP